MSDSILDNQGVTAEILNDIAIDLGATSFNEFGEEKFGADALNSITSALVGKGILNTVNRCVPILSGSTLIISTGIIVFESGAKKKIDETFTIMVQNGSCVYALNDKITNTCNIVASKSEPTEGDYVMIAEIDDDGNLHDRRTLSKANFETYTKPKTILLQDIAVKYKDEKDTEYSVPVGTEAFSYVLLRKSFHGNAFADLSRNDTIWTGNYNYLKFRQEGQNLIIITRRQGSGAGSTDTLTLEVI